MQRKNLHIAYLFASPLIMKRGIPKQVMKINFEKEFNEILKALNDTKKNILYKKLLATVDNLGTILLQTP